MSDARAAAAVKPATDAEVDGLIRTCRLNAAPDTIWGRVLQEGALKLAARISADAARIRELEARQVPDGWQVVPKEPTLDMEVAGTEEWLTIRAMEDRAAPIYRAMLAAAPRP